MFSFWGDWHGKMFFMEHVGVVLDIMFSAKERLAGSP